MKPVPENQLYPAPVGEAVYSRGRSARFRRCRREFLFHYVTCRGGYDPGQPEEIRYLYLLKQMRGWDEWLDAVLFDGIRAASGEMLHPGNWYDRLLDQCRRRVFTGIRDVALELWRDDPAARLQLREVRRRRIDMTDISDRAWEAVRERVRLVWDVLGEEWRRLPRPAWRNPESPLRCEYQGVTVYRGRALAWLAGGRLTWLDWNGDGAEGGDAWARYYAWKVAGVRPERCDVGFYHPLTGEWTPADPGSCDFTAAAERAMSMAYAMRDWLSANVHTPPGEFQPENPEVCEFCRFREYCAGPT